MTYIHKWTFVSFVTKIVVFEFIYETFYIQKNLKKEMSDVIYIPNDKKFYLA